jgi:hypothetical protein
VLQSGQHEARGGLGEQMEGLIGQAALVETSLLRILVLGFCELQSCFDIGNSFSSRLFIWDPSCRRRSQQVARGTTGTPS